MENKDLKGLLKQMDDIIETLEKGEPKERIRVILVNPGGLSIEEFMKSKGVKVVKSEGKGGLAVSLLGVPVYVCRLLKEGDMKPLRVAINDLSYLDAKLNIDIKNEWKEYRHGRPWFPRIL